MYPKVGVTAKVTRPTELPNRFPSKQGDSTYFDQRALISEIVAICSSYEQLFL